MPSKSRVSVKAIERDYPHHVEVLVPEGGLSRRLVDMQNWLRAHRIKVGDGRELYTEPYHYVTYCFANAKDAKDFAELFGGEVKDATK